MANTTQHNPFIGRWYMIGWQIKNGEQWENYRVFKMDQYQWIFSDDGSLLEVVQGEPDNWLSFSYNPDNSILRISRNIVNQQCHIIPDYANKTYRIEAASPLMYCLISIEKPSKQSFRITIARSI